MNSQLSVFVSSLSLALLLVALSEACTCGPQHPQTKFCTADVVIRGKIVGMEQISMDNQTDGAQWIRYEVKQSKMFKGFERVADVQYIYTPHDGGVCGFELDPSGAAKQTELVVAGMLTEDGRLTVSVCSFIQPWDKLSPGQRRGIMYTYKNHCDCRINPCHSVPCALNSEAECLWTDGLFSRGWDHVQARQYACVHQEGAACGWAPQKPLRADANLRAQQH